MEVKVTEFGTIMDRDMNYFAEFCSGKDLGYLMGLLNYIKLMYEEIRSQKDEAVMISTSDLPEAQEARDLIPSLYGILFKLEERALYLTDEVNKRVKLN